MGKEERRKSKVWKAAKCFTVDKFCQTPIFYFKKPLAFSSLLTLSLISFFFFDLRIEKSIEKEFATWNSNSKYGRFQKLFHFLFLLREGKRKKGRNGMEWNERWKIPATEHVYSKLWDSSCTIEEKLLAKMLWGGWRTEFAINFQFVFSLKFQFIHIQLIVAATD